MGYAVRSDNCGWRAVNDPEDVGSDETYSDTIPTLGLSDLQVKLVSQVKSTCAFLLAPSDWRIIAKIERNKEIPAEIVAYRKAVIDAAAANEKAIMSKKKVETLEALELTWPAPLSE